MSRWSESSAQLRALLRVYFLMAARGKVGATLSRKWGGGSRGLLVLVGTYVFMGLFAGSLGATHPDVFTFSLILYTMTFFLVGMALTAESGDILFNVAESDVMGALPVSPRVHLLAKSLNVLSYALLLALSFNLPGLFFGLATTGVQPWFPVAHLVGTILLSAFCAALVVFVYGLIIRFVDRERVDNFAAYAQVGLAIIFILGYQVLPRLMRRVEGVDLRGSAGKMLPLPPAWFAGWDAVTGGAAADGRMFALAALGVGATAAVGIAAVVKLSRGYESGISGLRESSTEKRGATGPGIEAGFLLRGWLRDPIERASFRLAAVYMRRDREIKLRLYPSLSFVLIFPLLQIISPDRNHSGLMPLATLWMIGMVPVMALESMRNTSQYAAAEIFRASPVPSIAPIFHGFRKATIVLILLPCVLVGGTLLVALAPDRGALFATALPALIALPTLSLAPGIAGSYLPLSEPPIRGSSSRNVTLMLISMLVVPMLLGIAYLTRLTNLYWPAIGIEAVLIFLIHRAINRRIARRPVPQIR